MGAMICAAGRPIRMGDDLFRVERRLAARLEALFERCPALHGFTVQDRALQSGARDPDELLSVGEISVYPLLGKDQSDAIYEEIARTLMDLLSEHPRARELLHGRTIARAVH
jgi:hypothetical protein